MDNYEINNEENSVILNKILENIKNENEEKDNLIENLQNELNEDLFKLNSEKATIQPRDQTTNSKYSTKNVSTSAKSKKQNNIQSNTPQFKEIPKQFKVKEKEKIINKDSLSNNKIDINLKKEEINNDINDSENNDVNNNIFIEGKRNFDDIVIKKPNLNFNQLLEKELQKEEKENDNIGQNESTKPKFKYISKKKVDKVFNKPIKNKKYKYYSDNFKIKPTKKLKKYKKAENQNSSLFSFIEKNKKENNINNSNQKDINDFKNYNMENLNHNNNIPNNNAENSEKNEYSEHDDFNDININKKLNYDILDGEYKNEDKNEYGDVNEDENENGEGDIHHDKFEDKDEENIIIMNNYAEMKKAETEKNKNIKKIKKENKEIIDILNNKDNDILTKNYMDILDEQYENDIKKISDYLYNKKSNKNKKNQEENFLQDITNLIANSDNNINIKNYNSNDAFIDDLDTKEIFRQFADELNKKSNRKESAPKSKSKGKKNKNGNKKKSSRKKFYSIVNNSIKDIESKLGSNEQKNSYNSNNKENNDINFNNNYEYKNNFGNNYEKDERINELVKEKKVELKKYLELLQKEMLNVNDLKNQYEKLKTSYNNELEKHQRKKEQLKIIYSLKKEEEIKKIEKERENLKNEKLFIDYPKQTKKDEVSFLKSEINKIKMQINDKEEYYKNTMEKLEKQYKENCLINIQLRKKLNIYESQNQENSDDDFRNDNSDNEYI